MMSWPQTLRRQLSDWMTSRGCQGPGETSGKARWCAGGAAEEWCKTRGYQRFINFPVEKFEVGPARVMCISWAMRMQQLYDADKAGRFATAETREEVNAGIQEEPEFQELAETGTAAVKAMRQRVMGHCCQGIGSQKTRGQWMVAWQGAGMGWTKGCTRCLMRVKDTLPPWNMV